MSDLTPPQPPQQPPYAQPAYQAPPAPSYQAPGYPTQAYPGAMPTYGYAGMVPIAKTNGLSVASMIVSILGFVWVLPLIGGLVGAIMGHIALGQIKQTGDKGRGMALAGVIVGWVGFAGTLLFGLFIVLGIIASLDAGSMA